MAPGSGASPTPSIPDRLLVRRVAEGDRGALRELRLRYGPTAYAVAYSVVVDPEQAEAAVAEAFTLAWHRARDPRGPGDSVSAWITRLTREAAERLRRPA
ncbi:MAG TPA: sigma factor [Gemmatimonadales bacterium]|nr:sigma factor [Gemmatimonadales bacterium]